MEEGRISGSRALRRRWVGPRWRRALAVRAWVSRCLRALVVAAALGALPVMTANAATQLRPSLRAAAPPTGPVAVPGEIVVGFRSGVGASERVTARSAAQVAAKR